MCAFVSKDFSHQDIEMEMDPLFKKVMVDFHFALEWRLACVMTREIWLGSWQEAVCTQPCDQLG